MNHYSHTSNNQIVVTTFRKLFASISSLLKRLLLNIIDHVNNKFFSSRNNQPEIIVQKNETKSGNYLSSRSTANYDEDSISQCFQEEDQSSSPITTAVYATRESEVHPYDFCYECNQKISEESNPLLKRNFITYYGSTTTRVYVRSGYCCTGCKRLFGVHIHNNLIKNAIKKVIVGWLLFCKQLGTNSGPFPIIGAISTMQGLV